MTRNRLFVFQMVGRVFGHRRKLGRRHLKAQIACLPCDPIELTAAIAPLIFDDHRTRALQ